MVKYIRVDFFKISKLIIKQGAYWIGIKTYEIIKTWRPSTPNALLLFFSINVMKIKFVICVN